MRVQSVGEYYTLNGAAEALGASYWQVWRAIRQRQAPTLLLGQTLLVKLADLRRALGGASARGEAENAGAGRPQAPAAEGAGDQQEQAAQPSAASALLANAAADYRVRGQVCPECGSSALVYQEGCQTCLACGYSVC